jgi:hypothetical protein
MKIIITTMEIFTTFSKTFDFILIIVTKKMVRLSPLPRRERARVRGNILCPPPPQSSPVEGEDSTW